MFNVSRYLPPQIQANLRPAFIGALANIPLSLSIAIASGATPLQGIITALFAGIAGGLLSGSSYGVIAPTGALSGLVAAYALLYGGETLPWLTAYIGMLILLFYLLRWYRYIIYIPVNVIHGFILGVSITIILNQFDFALGLSELPQHKEMVLNALESVKHAGEAGYFNIAVFLGGMLFLYLWGRYFPTFPGLFGLSLIAMLLGFSLHLKGGVYLPVLADRYGDNCLIPSASLLPGIPPDLLNRDFLIAGFVIAVIAVLETLITGRAAESLTGDRFRQRNEILALGVANVGSGIFGGIPATSGRSRMLLNIDNGVKEKTASLLNGVLVGVISLCLIPLLKYLPIATAGSILVYVAVKMVDYKELLHLYRHDRTVFAFSMLVAFLTVVEEPIIGVLVGAVISLLNFVNNLSKGHAELTVLNTTDATSNRIGIQEYIEGSQQGNVLIYRFAGAFTYVTAPAHIEFMEQIRGGKTVILSFRNLFYLDLDGTEYLGDMVKMIEKKGNAVVLAGISKQIRQMLEGEAFYRRKVEGGDVYDSTSAVLAKIKDSTDRQIQSRNS